MKREVKRGETDSETGKVAEPTLGPPMGSAYQAGSARRESAGHAWRGRRRRRRRRRFNRSLRCPLHSVIQGEKEEEEEEEKNIRGSCSPGLVVVVVQGRGKRFEASPIYGGGVG